MEYEDALKKYIFKYVQNDGLTAEVVQEILLKVHKSCCSDIEIKNLRSWLFQIAHNQTMDFFNDSKKEDTNAIFETVCNEADVYQDFSFYLEPLISRLPEKYAEPLKMAEIDGFTQQQVADKLCITLSAAKSRIQRARKLLRKKISCCFHVNLCCDSKLTDFKLKNSCTAIINWEQKNN